MNLVYVPYCMLSQSAPRFTCIAPNLLPESHLRCNKTSNKTNPSKTSQKLETNFEGLLEVENGKSKNWQRQNNEESKVGASQVGISFSTSGDSGEKYAKTCRIPAVSLRVWFLLEPNSYWAFFSGDFSAKAHDGTCHTDLHISLFTYLHRLIYTLPGFLRRPIFHSSIQASWAP